jgi:hypothetical protein
MTTKSMVDVVKIYPGVTPLSSSDHGAPKHNDDVTAPTLTGEGPSASSSSMVSQASTLTKAVANHGGERRQAVAIGGYPGGPLLEHGSSAVVR